MDETELRLIPASETMLPLKISGWNFEDLAIEIELEDKLRDFILDFLKTYRSPAGAPLGT